MFRTDSMSAEETNIELHRRHSRSVLVNELSFSCEDADSCLLAWEMRPYRLFLSCHGGFRRPWFHEVERPTNWSSQRVTSSEIYIYFTIIHDYYLLLLQVYIVIYNPRPHRVYRSFIVIIVPACIGFRNVRWKVSYINCKFFRDIISGISHMVSYFRVIIAFFIEGFGSSPTRSSF